MFLSMTKYAAKLRHVADLLDELSGLDRPTKHETPATAAKIRSSLSGPRRKEHWTQRPENAGKLRRMGKALAARRKAAKAKA